MNLDQTCKNLMTEVPSLTVEGFEMQTVQRQPSHHCCALVWVNFTMPWLPCWSVSSKLRSSDHTFYIIRGQTRDGTQHVLSSCASTYLVPFRIHFISLYYVSTSTIQPAQALAIGLVRLVKKRSKRMSVNLALNIWLRLAYRSSRDHEYHYNFQA